jgi:hypothetical protein
MGENKKGIEYLRKYSQRDHISSGIIASLNHYPPFEQLRFDPEFKELSEDLETRYRKQHSSIRKMLVKEGFIQ